MSDQTTTPTKLESDAAEKSSRALVGHAKMIGLITFGSRILGVARESIAAHFFGNSAVYSAFTFAFTIPNLFRKLLGEGALSSAFIPLYAQAVKREQQGHASADAISANDFAAGSVNLLCAILLGLSIVGEILLVGLVFSIHRWAPHRWDWLLATHLTMIMLPYVLLVCGTAFLGSILQVHNRFAVITFTAVLSNVCLIVAMILAARRFDMRSDEGQMTAVRWLSFSVLIAGVLQILSLLPSLRATGFRFRPNFHFWTPAVRKMVTLTIPVALSGAAVLQISVLMDKGIAYVLSRGPGINTTKFLGHSITLPMAEGAIQRLNWAQFLYQFPLGVFAIALATAIFPKLSADAIADSPDGGHAHTGGLLHYAANPRIPEQFKSVLRRGIEASLFIGLPASVGMIVVARPAVQVLFQSGKFTDNDTRLVAMSAAIYSAAIWAFSLQQILNRAYYSLHDTRTPLIWGIVNLVVNTIVEIPLLWTHLEESGMAVGTLVSFAMQSLLMVWMLDRRCDGLDLKRIGRNVGVMIVASLAMLIVCLEAKQLLIFPKRLGRTGPAMQLAALMALGGLVYFGICHLMGINVTQHLRLRRKR